MQPLKRPKTQGHSDIASNTVSGEFFVPDLCGPRPVFVMVMLAELLVLVHTLASSTLPRFDWDLLAIGSLFVQWIVLLSAAMLCLSRKVLSRVSLYLAASACLFIIVLVTAVSSYFAQMLYPQFSPAFPGGVSGAGGWSIVRNVALATILGGIALRYFYLQQQLQLREKSELQARLDSLRSRIRPHFLFNTMNSIASLIATQPDAAERAVEDLSELFRSSLQESSRAGTVADELRLCELYLGIEQLRLGERLSVAWQLDTSLREEAMPNLILQPLVENAVYHGIAQLAEGGTISISVQRVGGFLVAEIENPIPEHSVHSQGHHMALGNIEQRLEALFAGQASLKAERDGGFYRVKLRYPLGHMG
ncbi:MAG: sensor histidine kinase [Proteobacteria bacterium]|nr:sensor histidine kinase [Pseudomonadota bacterium]